MSDKRKAALSVAALKAAGETAALRETAISIQDSTTKTTGPQVTISGFLHIGRENALPLRDLCQLTGMDGRQVRLIIQQERLKGAPILSDNQKGYYLPDNEREVVEFVRSMRHRAGEITATACAVEKAVGLL